MHRAAKIKRSIIVRYIPQKYLRFSTAADTNLYYHAVRAATDGSDGPPLTEFRPHCSLPLRSNVRNVGSFLWVRSGARLQPALLRFTEMNAP